MISLRKAVFTCSMAIIICGLFDHAFAQTDSVAVDTLISRAYIQFWEASEFDIPDEFDIYIIKSDTTYSIAERVKDSSGAHMLWVFDLHPPRGVDNCEYKPHIRGFESELMGMPDIEQEGNKWIARCTFRLNKIWQVEVESDPGGVGVIDHNLEKNRSTDFTTPPMPWDQSLKLELYCVPGYRFSYSVDLGADSLFNLTNGLVHDNKFIKSLILGDNAHYSISARVKMSKLVKVNKIIFKPKLP